MAWITVTYGGGGVLDVAANKLAIKKRLHRNQVLYFHTLHRYLTNFIFNSAH
jgi:hypothetical protein